MKLTFEPSSPSAVKSDAAAMFLYHKPSASEIAALAKRFGLKKLDPVESGDFQGKPGDTSVLYLSKQPGPRRLFLIGLGDKKKVTLEQFRRAGARAAKKAHELKARSLALGIPLGSEKVGDVVRALGEGALLGLYRFDKYLTKEEGNSHQVESIILCSDHRPSASQAKAATAQAQIVAESVATARDLSNAPGNEIYPETLAEKATELAEENGFQATVLDEHEIEELGMGGVMGVSRGSARPPRFLVLEYGPASAKPVVLVGKGVTFDSGGISIKPSANMGEMKMDMSGAAAVIGTFEAVSRLKLPVHLVGLVPSVENMPGGNSIRPGDVLRHYNGKTSEVDNTDAEGRLILADALGYAERFKPAAVIDLATLTGACVVALGHVATGMMGNDDDLMKRLSAAGNHTYERVWQLPLFEEYDRLIKSNIADVKNVGGRWGGAITAACFLKTFIGSYRWVHLDIAGTAMLEEDGDYTQRGGSGVGVRLLTEFLRRWK